MEPLLTTAQVAEWLNTTQEALRVMRHRGDGPPYLRLGHKPTSRVRYKKEDVEAWMQRTQTQPEGADHE